MKRTINSDQFDKLIESITEKQLNLYRQMNAAMISNNSLAENECRAKISALDLTIFSITLYSSQEDN